MADDGGYTVLASDGIVFARYGSMGDALRGARWLLADGQVAHARIEWTQHGRVRTRVVSRAAWTGGDPARTALTPRVHAGLFQPAVTGAVVAGAVALLGWALISALQLAAG